jgi:transcriptional regulator with XRE-family HTH domain
MLTKMRERRKELGLSQVKLGILCDMASVHISDIERGVRQPWPRARKAIAEALRMSEGDLFAEVQ